MDLKIRYMEKRDVDQVMEIEKEVYTSPWSRNAYELELSQNKLAQYYVAELDGKIVGIVGLWFIIGETHITTIAVDPDYQSQGIGSKLMEKGIREAIQMGSTAMTLEVRVSNTPAQNLYKKYGFKSYGIRPKYYGDNNEDALIMWKEIDEDEVV